jgi:hypothetical protein
MYLRKVESRSPERRWVTYCTSQIFICLQHAKPLICLQQTKPLPWLIQPNLERHTKADFISDNKLQHLLVGLQQAEPQSGKYTSNHSG